MRTFAAVAVVGPAWGYLGGWGDRACIRGGYFDGRRDGADFVCKECQGAAVPRQYYQGDDGAAGPGSAGCRADADGFSGGGESGAQNLLPYLAAARGRADRGGCRVCTGHFLCQRCGERSGRGGQRQHRGLCPADERARSRARGAGYPFCQPQRSAQQRALYHRLRYGADHRRSLEKSGFSAVFRKRRL